MKEIEGKADDTIVFRDELAIKSEYSKRARWLRFTLAVLEGVPWVGSLIGAATALKSEIEQGEVNDLHSAWIDSHRSKIEELKSMISSIIDSAEKNSSQAGARLEEDSYLSLVRHGTRVWDTATSQEKRDHVRRILTNASVSKIVSDDLVRLFLHWIESYDEIHFRVIGVLHRSQGMTRLVIWNEIDGRQVRENSNDADLYRMIIRDLSTGGVIRQHRTVTSGGQFLKKERRAGSTSISSTMKSAFDNTEPYELTELGQMFVGYALNEPSTSLPA
mgnify:CR=1 FL=1